MKKPKEVINRRGKMKCVKCDKDITGARFKVAYKDQGLCWLCYKKIPIKERVKYAKKE